MIHRPPFYRRPPVIERVLSVYSDMSDEVYEGRFEDWQAMVRKDYPVDETLTQWLILLKDKDKDQGEGELPLFDTMQPELRITPRFARKTGKEGFDWSVRCPRGQFTMNMHSHPSQGVDRRYPHLRAEYARWLPRWLAHFSVETATKVTVHYVNLVNRVTVPDFINAKGQLLLDKVLTVFAQIPGQHECLLPPFDCKATMRLEGKEGAILRLSVNDWSDVQAGASIRVDFIVEVPVGGRDASAESILELLDWCHERIVERFEVVFTESARRTFEPQTA